MADFVRVADVTEIPDPGKTLVEVAGEMVALFHVEGRYYALDDVCTHDGGPLADGELRDHKIACPRHGAKFDIRTGAALTMPAVRATRAHDVKVEGDGVWVRLRDDATADGPAAHASSSPAAAAAPAGASLATTTAAATSVPPPTVPTGALSEDSIREMLKDVKDPELFVNIVDLGLVYGVTLEPAADVPGKQKIGIDMTMTSPACPAGPQLIGDTKRVLAAHADVAAVEVRIVMDPPWTPDRMTEAARDQLGIF
ncbi:MAG: Rieske 2Fe-2S domain-containing protein [Pirellulales bacterium]|jgi:metal-sulfur cluster biosynthetic enzyme/nitrite reductase/ring-hydroxylating ferredoxin subunit